MLDPGEKIIDCPPTFSMYVFDAAVNGAGVIKGERFTIFMCFILFDFASLSLSECIVLNMLVFVCFTVPRNPDFSLNVDRIAEVVELEKPKCIFLTSPNNPDGR